VVVLGVLAATHHLSGTGTGARVRTPQAAAPAGPTGRGGGTPTPTASASPALPAGYRTYAAPEGFSVALPSGWKRLTTSRATDLAYRITFGTGGASPTLAVTYSRRVGPDPVAVWRDDVEPGLRQLPGYHRIGTVRATTYQGRAAADIEWLAGSGGARVHTFGRGFLLGGRRGFSLRFTTPSASWDDAANRLALRTFLQTFRETKG
jgi:hypothetical protein